MGAWADLAARLEHWLLPPECSVCCAPQDRRDLLVCDVCRSRWRAIDAPNCATCGEPSPLGLQCRVCAEWPPDFGPVRSAVRLDPAVRRLVHRFKYQGWRRLAESFAIRMAPLLGPFGDADLVPVPLAGRRRRERGYNQAEELAVALGAITGLPVRPRRLQRIRDTPSQTRLTPESRRANLADAFAAARSDRSAILVDDVFTTGATLCSAGSELLESGAARVAAVTFARAELPLTALDGLTRDADRHVSPGR
ncbi:MAG: ComF family protein [Gemmatimonadales bacterium]